MRRCSIGLIALAALVAVPPATAESSPVKAQLTSAVGASRAKVRLLDVSARTRKLALDVSVRDPAAYLKHRYGRVVRTIYPRLVGRYRSISLHVFDAHSGRAVLSYSDVVVGPNGGRSQTWHIVPRYVDCARNLPLDDIEIDPERTATRCPAA